MRAADDLRAWYGWAELFPAGPIEAGSLGRWQVLYHVGRYGLAAGGSLRLLFPAGSDWPALQGQDPYLESFATVTTTGRARLTWRYEARAHAEPWPRAAVVEVAQAPLVAGDTVLLYLGDPEGGSPGVRAQTFAQKGYEFRVAVDAFAHGNSMPVPSPTADIVGGPAARLEIVAPSRAAPGAPCELTVRVEDRWGNLARAYAGTLRLEGLPGLGAVDLTRADGSVRRVHATAPSQPGIYRVRGREVPVGLRAESNPLQVLDRALVRYWPLWGDLHGHGPEPHRPGAAAACLAHAHQVAALDYCSHQASDQQMTPACWREVQEATRRHNEPGRFVTLLGYGWAGNTAGGGAHNVLLAGDAAPLYCGADPSPGAEGVACFPLGRLRQALQEEGALLIASMGGPQVDLEQHDGAPGLLLEVHSSWGQAPWLVEEALRRGLPVGFVAGGGDARGRPGGSAPGAGDLVSRGGLTCVLAAEKTREAVWEALRARRCYATSGARILLEVQADGHEMGEEFGAVGPLRFAVRVAGTAEVERVEIRRGSQVAWSYPERPAPRAGWVRVVWGGALARDWPRQAPWDGTLRVHGARILAALPYGFDSPARGLILSNERAVSWRSTTASNENGLLLRLDPGPQARLEYHSPLATLDLALSDLPHEEQLGGEGLFVRLEPLPEGSGRRDLELSWTERELPPGTTAYHVLVQQVDGARAWSSPLYVRASPAGQFPKDAV